MVNKIDLFAIDCKGKMQTIANFLWFVVNKVLRLAFVRYIVVSAVNRRLCTSSFDVCIEVTGSGSNTIS